MFIKGRIWVGVIRREFHEAIRTRTGFLKHKCPGSRGVEGTL